MSLLSQRGQNKGFAAQTKGKPLEKMSKTYTAIRDGPTGLATQGSNRSCFFNRRVKTTIGGPLHLCIFAMASQLATTGPLPSMQVDSFARLSQIGQPDRRARSHRVLEHAAVADLAAAGLMPERPQRMLDHDVLATDLGFTSRWGNPPLRRSTVQRPPLA